jgi:predicted phosphodiesterase
VFEPPTASDRRLLRVAAVYDIHGNLPALDAVLAEIERVGVDRIVVGGDVVPGPMARETIARLTALDVPLSYIQGNGEVAVLDDRVGAFSGALPAQARASIHATAQALSDEEAAMLASWPMLLTVGLEGIGDVLFCHGTPRHCNEIFTEATPEAALLPIFDPLNVSLVVCGHTHMPFDRLVGRTRVVNAGSVGLPFGTTGADWLLLGPGVEPRHTDYDLEDAANVIRRTRAIDAEGFARQILQPAGAAQMIDTLSRAELRYGRTISARS